MSREPHINRRVAQLVAILGMACFWTLFRRNVLFHVLAGHGSIPGGDALLYAFYLVVLLIVICLCVRLSADPHAPGSPEASGSSKKAARTIEMSGAASNDRSLPARSPKARGTQVRGTQAMTQPLPDRRTRRILLAACGVQAALKVVLCSIPPLAGPVAVLAGIADVALFSIVFATLCLLWAGHVCALPRAEAAQVSIGSFIVSFLVQQVAWLPGTAALVATAVIPFASLLAVLTLSGGCSASREGSSFAGAQETDARGTDANGAAPGVIGKVADIDRPWRPSTTVIVVMLFLLASSVLRGLVSGDVTGDLQQPPVSQDALSIAFSCVLLAFVSLPGARRRLPEIVWPLTVVILFSGVLLMMLVGDEQRSAGAAIMMMGRTCLSPLLWLFLVDEARRSGVPSTRVFATCFLGCDWVSSLLGYLVVPALASAAGLDASALMPVMAAAMALVMMAVSVFAFSTSILEGGDSDARGTRMGPEVNRAAGGVISPNAGGGTVADASDGSDSQAHPDASRRNLLSVSSTYLLTEKETEVAALLAAGNSQKKIAEELHISVSTVQTHVKGIYRKLGIHTRQELIDLVHGGGA